MVIRKLVLAPGAYADTDWTDPAIVIPDAARRFKVTGPLRFSIRGRADTTPGAEIVSIGSMTVDAYVLTFDADGGRSRGRTLAEVEAGALPAQIMISSNGQPRGVTGVLHLDLVNVSAPVLEVLLLAGGRPL